jgi:hypothetical protein
MERRVKIAQFFKETTSRHKKLPIFSAMQMFSYRDLFRRGLLATYVQPTEAVPHTLRASGTKIILFENKIFMTRVC